MAEPSFGASETARLVRMVISSVVAGMIGIGSNLLTALNANTQGEISKGTITVAVVTGAILMLKDIQAYLSQPPAAPQPPPPTIVAP